MASLSIHSNLPATGASLKTSKQRLELKEARGIHHFLSPSGETELTPRQASKTNGLEGRLVVIQMITNQLASHQGLEF
jgi:hypothetical protein